MEPHPKPSLPHTQGLADSAIDAAWALMPPDLEPDTLRMLPIVVGAHPRGEIADRPLANRLVAAIRQWQRAHITDEATRLIPMVMTDLWYLNERVLRHAASPRIRHRWQVAGARGPPISRTERRDVGCGRARDAHGARLVY